VIHGSKGNMMHPLAIRTAEQTQTVNLLTGMLEQSANKSGLPNESFQSLVEWETDKVGQNPFTAPYSQHATSSQLQSMITAAEDCKSQLIQTFIAPEMTDPQNFQTWERTGFFPPQILSDPTILPNKQKLLGTDFSNCFPETLFENDVTAILNLKEGTAVLDVWTDGGFLREKDITRSLQAPPSLLRIPPSISPRKREVSLLPSVLRFRRPIKPCFLSEKPSPKTKLGKPFA
jgi:hypothetical protein